MNFGNGIIEIHSTAREVLQWECPNEIYQLWQPVEEIVGNYGERKC